jgi:signal transduction histidine kinase
MTTFIPKSWVNLATASIILLVILNIFITRRNNTIIEENKLLQQQTEQIKVTVSQFAIIIIHNLDLGLRGYALFGKDKYLFPMKFALRDKDSLFYSVRRLLEEQKFPLEEFDRFEDSTEAYATQCVKMKILFDENKKEEFYRLADLDNGYKLWLQYEKVSQAINRFENTINAQAQKKYSTALSSNYTIQLILLLICVPTLIFTAFHTNREWKTQVRLRELEAEKVSILARQNDVLEKLVATRTHEIHQQNIALQHSQGEIEAQNEELKSQQEEISSQRDLLARQNKKLNQAKEIILRQNKEIRATNESLEEDIKERTKVLVEYNQQLEQFAFIAAHNLRAPAARILGLGKVLELSEDNKDEERAIIRRLISSTAEMDTVIKDLNVILEIKSNNSNYFTSVNLYDELTLVRSNLAREILETNASIQASFDAAPIILSVKPYVDSILFNLISNAIKYRNPDKVPVIDLKTEPAGDFICLTVSDNGLGFDVDQQRRNIFTLYKRFHFHVEGKGMGLYLVKTQVTALGGRIEVDSQVNEGTTFRVYFKRRQFNST